MLSKLIFWSIVLFLVELQQQELLGWFSMFSRLRMDIFLDGYSFRNGEFFIVFVFFGDQEQVGGQGLNIFTVFLVSVGRVKGGCFFQGLVGRRELVVRIGENSQDIGFRRVWQFIENSFIVGIVFRVRWTGKWFMQDIVGSFFMGVGLEDIEVQGVLWLLFQRRRVFVFSGLLSGRYFYGSYWRFGVYVGEKGIGSQRQSRG